MKKRVYAGKRSKSAPAKRRKAQSKALIGGLLSGSTNSRAKWTRARLVYSDFFQLDPSIGSLNAVKVFTTNGLYDPDHSGSGHQPAGFDQYMGLYNEYVVVASKIKVQATNHNSGQELVLGVAFNDLATTSTDIREYVENGACKTAMMTRNSNDVATLYHSCNMRTVSTQDIFAESNFTGGAAANPADTHYWHVFTGNPFSGGDPSPISIAVQIEYDTYFRDPKFTGLS